MLFSRTRGSPPRRWIYLLSASLSLLLVRYLFWSTPYGQVAENVSAGSSSVSPSSFECPHLPGLEDVLVVLKTGVTEALEKVPVHFNTTLRCIPHYVVFSDFEEDIAGVRAHDVLRSVEDTVKRTNSDFAIYNNLRESGRKALTSNDNIHDESTPFGKPDNPGWKLDKWKFLPMIDETLNFRNNAKWYVFVEADTYMVWPNLMAWLATFDHIKPQYLGNQMQIADVVFGHGGSGFVLSHAAMQKVSEFRASRVKEWDEFTDGHWAGDCVLGKALGDAGVKLFWAWPMLQGSTPWEFDFFSEGYQKKPWCIPPVAYHHLTADDVREMWEFEENWSTKNPISNLLHSHVFENLIQPKLKATESNWDNLSADDSGQTAESPADCEAQCVKNPDCLQYSFESSKCLTSKVAKRGGKKAGVTSGWMSERIEAATKELGSCKKAEWVS
ncbi:hypothetical protein ASPWEDRAFT_174852 [Aspergillus wentii DTO 134E9]|uniref:N-acetylgalactosaminide beta-1,3-galactosyltransferase n=1 Tax=Aspergillus wentii DTO 134E9 TaxID=1073089 RepID=A0A1L9REU2_ASPWE|nr:uncharacterized protein ASPWEDRAFT_174852 [Aspergillus wentii DTO 134E9]OJJ33446.1 hypothetical protein ASPWEDRAFT_174852 [Aspergillus wentii DTO 134E9]